MLSHVIKNSNTCVSLSLFPPAELLAVLEMPLLGFGTLRQASVYMY